MNKPDLNISSFGRWVAPVFLTAVLLAGCGTYVPDGATVVAVKNSNHEFDRASLHPSNELAKTQNIQMKWYDTNTFLTTATLAPGIYDFRARNYDGAAISHDIAVKPDEDLYEVDVAAIAANADKPAQTTADGPLVRGSIQGLPSGQNASSVAVLFIGRQIVLKTVEVKRDGSFQVEAPSKGSWKIEVHLLGAQPKSYTHAVVNVQGPINLGAVALQ